MRKGDDEYRPGRQRPPAATAVSDRVRRTRDSYDRVAADYDRQTREGTSTLPALQALAAAVDGPVADLGCGPGRDLALLRSYGVPAIGVDLSAGMLAVARTRGVPVVQGDLRRPPLRPGSLAGIWSSAALLHVPRDDVPTTLAAWHRLLHRGGRLSLTTSLGDEDGWELVPYAGADPAGGELHRWYVHHDEPGLLAALDDAGFTVTSTERRHSSRTWLAVEAVARRAGEPGA